MAAGTEERRGKVYLDMPVNYLKGVGPVRAESLRRLGIVTARDLLYHIPHRYEDASTISPIASLEPGMDGTIIGKVISKGIIPTRKGLRIFQAVLQDDSGMIEASWPGQPFLDRSIEKGDIMLRVHPEVVKQLKSNNASWLHEMEELTGKTILVKSDPSLHPEQFDIH